MPAAFLPPPRPFGGDAWLCVDDEDEAVGVGGEFVDWAAWYIPGGMGTGIGVVELGC